MECQLGWLSSLLIWCGVGCLGGAFYGGLVGYIRVLCPAHMATLSGIELVKSLIFTEIALLHKRFTPEFPR